VRESRDDDKEEREGRRLRLVKSGVRFLILGGNSEGEKEAIDARPVC
jgi:hypothetical protein